MWIDSHCHITADRFDADRMAVLERAREARLDQLIAIGSGYGMEHNELAARLAHETPGVFATAGLHPHDAALWNDASETSLRQWLAQTQVVAVGECGLDYHYMNSPRAAQQEALAAQIALAAELGLPVSIHVRDDGPRAYEELLEIWKNEGRGALSGVLHCYTGNLDFAKRGLEEGFYISFSGIVTFKKSDDLRAVVRGLPIERLMVETDAPFLAPEGHRGKRNEPAWVERVGATLAQIHGVSQEEIAQITSRNARQLFGIDAGEQLGPKDSQEVH